MTANDRLAAECERPMLCPKCAGLGWVQYNPQMPFGGGTSAGPWRCPACIDGIIYPAHPTPPTPKVEAWEPVTTADVVRSLSEEARRRLARYDAQESRSADEDEWADLVFRLAKAMIVNERTWNDAAPQPEGERETARWEANGTPREFVDEYARMWPGVDGTEWLVIMLERRDAAIRAQAAAEATQAKAELAGLREQVAALEEELREERFNNGQFGVGA